METLAVTALVPVGAVLIALLAVRLAPRPTWRARFDPPGRADEGRDSKIDLWRRG